MFLFCYLLCVMVVLFSFVRGIASRMAFAMVVYHLLSALSIVFPVAIVKVDIAFHLAGIYIRELFLIGFPKV